MSERRRAEVLEEGTVAVPAGTLSTCSEEVDKLVLEALDVSDLYLAGVEAYQVGKWSECASFMQRALEDHRRLRKQLIDCRIKCQQTSSTGVNREDFLELAFFDAAVKRSLCIHQCQGSEHNIPTDPNTEQAFDNLEPYHYWQICAYEIGDIEKAAAASFTYLTAHPDNHLMRNNVEFYGKLDQSKPSFFQDLELLPHQLKFWEGKDAYMQQEWETVVKIMEEALHLYYLEDLRCAAMCEIRYDHVPGTDFFTDVTYQWIELMKCKSQCPKVLATVSGTEVEDYLAEHYNYLQYSHYHLGNKNKALNCIATYLLFRPDNEAMIKNKVYFFEEEGISRDQFTVRQDASSYHKRHLLENMLLGSAQQLQSLHLAKLGSGQDQIVHDFDMYGLKSEVNNDEMLAFEKMGVQVISGEDMFGEHRVVADGLASEEDCTALVKLAEMTMMGTKLGTMDLDSPSVVTPVHAAEMAVHGLVPENSVLLWLNVVETSRKFLQSSLRLKKPLYFHHIYITCLNGPIEKCILQPDGSCATYQPQTEPEFGSLIYLSKDDHSGNFVFINKDPKPESSVEAQEGRFVGFSSTDRHELHNVTLGKQCVLAVWYTLDPREQELSHSQARMVLQLDKNKMKELKDSRLKTFLKRNSFNVIMTEDELNGPQRFAADGLASETECEALIKLANSRGMEGDGYKSTDPLTSHENYAGLTVAKAAELAVSGVVAKETVQAYLDLSERGRLLVQTYFKVKLPMYFDYTQLVCRTARNEKNTARKDLSHPIHADNCIIQEDNSCLKVAPAYTQRDYSALLYLNGEFTGGEFFFAHENMTVQSSVKPKCGLIVGFNATNYHGVKAVVKGQRCAVAMWYTLDPHYREESHNTARDTIASLGQKSKTKRHRSTDHNEL